jgi:hypothetical protein
MSDVVIVWVAFPIGLAFGIGLFHLIDRRWR